MKYLFTDILIVVLAIPFIIIMFVLWILTAPFRLIKEIKEISEDE